MKMKKIETVNSKWIHNQNVLLGLKSQSFTMLSVEANSVNLINAGQPERMTDAEWADTVARNKEHLTIMLAKDFWTTENLTPLQQAAGE